MTWHKYVPASFRHNDSLSNLLIFRLHIMCQKPFVMPCSTTGLVSLQSLSSMSFPQRRSEGRQWLWSRLWKELRWRRLWRRIRRWIWGWRPLQQGHEEAQRWWRGVVQTSLRQKRRWTRMVNRFQEHILDNTPLLPFGPLSTGLFWTPTDLFSLVVV